MQVSLSRQTHTHTHTLWLPFWLPWEPPRETLHTTFSQLWLKTFFEALLTAHSVAAHLPSDILSVRLWITSRKRVENWSPQFSCSGDYLLFLWNSSSIYSRLKTSTDFPSAWGSIGNDWVVSLLQFSLETFGELHFAHWPPFGRLWYIWCVWLCMFASKCCPEGWQLARSTTSHTLPILITNTIN